MSGIAPCSIIIFGATGDLTARKIMPALYQLMQENRLPVPFTCMGFARREKQEEVFRFEMRRAVEQFSRTRPIEDGVWNRFQNSLYYHVSEFHDDAGYIALKARLEALDVALGGYGNRIYYLAVPPSYFPLICQKLHQHALLYDDTQVQDRWSRVIVEKPFGIDLSSAHLLQEKLLQCMSERQIYRIDHYLGKEMVQNLLLFRWVNPIFESLWNRNHIDRVEIWIAEEIGVGTRGKFLESAGLLRDMFQNHMMQLLSLTAMELPKSLCPEEVRDQKVALLQAISPLVPERVVRGQYGPGLVKGNQVRGYREEFGVDPHSTVETYVALSLYIDNPRWAGVPFHLRSGKRLPEKKTEIIVTFKNGLANGREILSEPNQLIIRIQPDEGMALRINGKLPGTQLGIQPIYLDTRNSSLSTTDTPEAYERLLYDCMKGDPTLFARQDEVLAAWRIFDPILQHWQQIKPTHMPNYPAGSWGPLDT